MLVSNNYKMKYSFLCFITFTNSKTPDDEIQSTKVNHLKSERIAFVERLKAALSKANKRTGVFPSLYLTTERSPYSKTWCYFFFCDSLNTRSATEFGSLVVPKLKRICVSADHRQ